MGEGLSCSSKNEVQGELAYIQTIEDVINLFDSAKDKICLVNDAGITTLGPILSELKGALCTTGGPGSHLAIISREYSLPCIMAIKLKVNISKVNGKQVKVIHDGNNRGFVYLIE
jgi:phosphoenolpyruvate-protein kinase (PTS system EI component)